MNTFNTINYLRRQLVEYYQKNGLKTAVFGKSMGIDSSVVAGLLAGVPEIQPLGVIMPCDSDPKDEKIAREVLEFYRLPIVRIDLGQAYDILVHNFYQSANLQEQLSKYRDQIQWKDDRDKYALGNIKARLRMITLYHIAQMTNGAVIGSSNFSEYMTGFWTLHGDVGDIYPILRLYKSSEIYEMAVALKVPESSLKAIPADGLGISKTDEEQLGIPYDKLDQIIEGYLKRQSLAQLVKTTGLGIKSVEMVVQRINHSQYKRKQPYILKKNKLSE
jgi:NAD+ synthetase